MSTPLIRFSKRRASWEPDTSDDELVDTEFKDKSGQPDLRPSVYEIAPARVVQAFAEHATMFEPPSSNVGVDLGGTGREVAVTPGQTAFAFTTQTHREIVLSNRADLVNMVREVRRTFADRAHAVTKDQVRAYVRERLDQGDTEWVSARAQPAAKRWLRKLPG